MASPSFAWNAPAMQEEVHFARHGRARVVRCFADRPRDLDALLADACRRSPDAEAVVDGEHRVTYRALEDRVARVAANLRRLGIRPGERVAYALVNRLEFVDLTLACFRCGAIAVPLNVRMRARENRHALQDSGAAAVIFEASLAGEVPAPEDIPNCRLRVVCGGSAPGALAYDDALLQPADRPAFEAPDEDAVAAILYTSGTTGLPKGAALTHLGIIHSAIHFETGAGLTPGERTIAAVPISHVTGLIANLVTMVRVAGCLVLMREFRAESFVDLAERERVSYALLVPAMFNLILLKGGLAGRDLSAWRIAGFGGAPMPASTIAGLAEALPGLRLMNAYGATETTSPATLMPPGTVLDEARATSIGRVLPCVDLTIRDEAGREVPPGVAGEIWIGGPNVVPGYWNNPAATEASFADGAWKSGDIGWIDPDGFVFIGDRKKDMVNRGGYKVYSVEVENVLAAHPGVAAVAVVGRPHPVLGEVAHAFVVAKPGLDLDALTAYARELLSDYKVPDAFTVVDGDDLPRNPNGKVLKAELRRRLAEEVPPAAPSAAGSRR